MNTQSSRDVNRGGIYTALCTRPSFRPSVPAWRPWVAGSNPSASRVLATWSCGSPRSPPPHPPRAPLGRGVHPPRQQSLGHLELRPQPFLPPGLLSQAEEGRNSRERVYSVRRTFFEIGRAHV